MSHLHSTPVNTQNFIGGNKQKSQKLCVVTIKAMAYDNLCTMDSWKMYKG